MVVGEAEQGELNVLPITSLNDRGFEAFMFNPLSSGKPDFAEVDIVDIYQEVKWFFPKLKHGHLLVTPIETKQTPASVLFVKEANKIPDVVDLGDVF